MRDLEGRLDRWSEAGLISGEQAEAIARYERERAAEDQADDRPEPRGGERRSDRRNLGAEAVGYVGAALALGAIGLLLDEVWEQLVVGGRLALVGLLSVLLGAGGLALRRSDEPPLQRLASVLFTGAIIGLGWFAGIVGDDVLGLPEMDVALLVGVVATAAAASAYAIRRRALPQLTLLAAVVFTIGALFSRSPLPTEPLWIGLTVWALGLAWLLAGAGGWLQPRRVAEVAGGALGLVAIQVASFEDARLFALALAVLTAGTLVALAITTDHVHHLAVGAVGLFVLVPQLVFELFGDAIGAPATLLVIGLLLVVLAVGLGRARREVGSPSDAPPRDGDEGDTEDRVRVTGGEER